MMRVKALELRRKPTLYREYVHSGPLCGLFYHFWVIVPCLFIVSAILTNPIAARGVHDNLRAAGRFCLYQLDKYT